jgi:hypothetical protein
MHVCGTRTRNDFFRRGGGLGPNDRETVESLIIRTSTKKFKLFLEIHINLASF